MALEILETVSSTMDAARQQVSSGAVTFDAAGNASSDGVLAYTQTAGRGQRGRIWHDAPGHSLCATFYFQREWAQPATAGALAFLAGVAAAEAIETDLTQRRRDAEREQGTGNREQGTEFSPIPYTPHPIPCIGLKWPNDLIVNGKKVGGILVEMVQAANGGWVALIGIGVNLRAQEFPIEVAPFATSLEQEGFNAPAPEILGEAIANALREAGAIYTAQGFPALLQRWRERDQTPGLRYQTELADSIVTGTAEGVSDTGALRFRLDDGRALDVISASSIQEVVSSQ